jgi:rhodanese-related sulfurtransferase
MTESSERPLEAPTRGSFRHLSAAEAWDLIFERQRSGGEDLALFDVRDEGAFKASHVEGAVHLAERALPGVLASLPKHTTVVVYCYHGHASQTFATTFSDFGFSDVHSVDGGFEALRAEHDERTRRDRDEPTLPQPNLPYLPGDMVFSRRSLYNDGGMPDCASDALIAPAGARGVIVKLGRAEAAPEQALYLVRFEDAQGVLGPPVGCLPEELTQEQRGA